MKPLHSAADEEAVAAAAAEKRPKLINVTGADGSPIGETQGPREVGEVVALAARDREPSC